MDTYHWSSYIKRVFKKSDDGSVLRKFLNSTLGPCPSPCRPESAVYFKKKVPNRNSLSSISDSSASAKRVTLNLSEIQIYDDESTKYLTPIQRRSTVSAKTYELPTPCKPEIITIRSSDSGRLDYDSVTDESSSCFRNANHDLENQKETQFPSYLSIKESSSNLNNQDTADTVLKKENKRNIPAAKSDNFKPDTPIKGILKVANKENAHTAESITLDRSINEKFVVNLFESRASKRWKQSETCFEGELRTLTIVGSEDKLRIDESNQPQAKLKGSLADVKFETPAPLDTGLLNVVSSSIICDMIKNLQHTIDRDFDEKAFFRKAFGSSNTSTDNSIPKNATRLSGESAMSPADEIFFKLKRETEIQCQKMIETSKIVESCRHKKAFIGSPMHIEAEKILLLSSFKHDQITQSILQNEYEDLDKSRIALGVLSVGNLQFPLENSKSSEWFVCILSSAEKVYISEPVLAKNNKVSIEDVYIFKNLDWDFEINISVYCMDINKSCKTKRWFFRKKKRPSPRTLRYKDMRTNTITESEITNSSFKLCGSAKLKKGGVKEGQILALNKDSAVSALENVVYLDAHMKDVVFQTRWSGFLTVGVDSSGFVAWNRRWCVLDGFSLKFFNYPIDEDYREPVEELNLKNVLSRSTDFADRSVCPRPRTLLLHVGKCRRRLRYFLSGDTLEELQEFKNIMDDVTTCLRSWKLLTYSDDVNNN